MFQLSRKRRLLFSGYMTISIQFNIIYLKVPAIRYTVQATTTATSCLSSRRLTTNNDTKVTAIATPTQSPTALTTTLTSEKSPTSGRQTRKHVQFPDTATGDDEEKSGDFYTNKYLFKVSYFSKNFNKIKLNRRLGTN